MGSEMCIRDSFKDFYKDKPLALIDFWASWCGPCRMLTPVLEELDKDTGLAIGKVNVDEEEEISEAFNVSSIPTLFLFKDGNLVDKRVGYMPLEELKSWIKTYE